MLYAATCCGQEMAAIRTTAIRTTTAAAVERASTIPASVRTEADKELAASFQARLRPAARTTQGEAWFTFTAEFTDATGARERMVGRIPIASTGDAYGESRSCAVRKDGGHDLVFTAGLDEANYVDFHARTAETHSYHFLLNKYLCRMLAAPFRCEGKPVVLPATAHEMARWRVVSVGLGLRSGRPGLIMATPVVVERHSSAFNYERCATVAPSTGLCCVQGRTTEWSCGIPPADGGWHQVSGECFHRETGGSCKDSW